MYIDREGREIQRYKAKTQVTEKNETREDSEHKVFTKVTLVHHSNSYANSNDIQKMIYNILEYAHIEFDYNLIFDGNTNKTESKSKWNEFKKKFVEWIYYVPEAIKNVGWFKNFSFKNEIGNNFAFHYLLCSYFIWSISHFIFYIKI